MRASLRSSNEPVTFLIWHVMFFVSQKNGKITYNGHELNEFCVQRTSAYISQTDSHIAELTVRETLDFGARCEGEGFAGLLCLFLESCISRYCFLEMIYSSINIFKSMLRSRLGHMTNQMQKFLGSLLYILDVVRLEMISVFTRLIFRKLDERTYALGKRK